MLSTAAATAATIANYCVHLQANGLLRNVFEGSTALEAACTWLFQICKYVQSVVLFMTFLQSPCSILITSVMLLLLLHS
jgi:hypothetical protein